MHIHTHTVQGIPLFKEGTKVTSKSNSGFKLKGIIRGYTRVSDFADIYIVELIEFESYYYPYSHYCIMPFMLEEIKWNKL